MTTTAPSPHPRPAADRSLAESPSRRRPPLITWIGKLTRWLHIYLSMFGFATILFFAVTGITLNHPAWFGLDEPHVGTAAGELPAAWFVATAAETAGGEATLDRLQIAEALRAEHPIRGALAEFRVDEFECTLGFKGPAYAADVVVDRESGRYEVTTTEHGAVALLNDLHKGRDTGAGWSWVIDVSAVLMAVSSLTGMILLLYIKRKRRPGLVVTFIGLVVLAGAYLTLVP